MGRDHRASRLVALVLATAAVSVTATLVIVAATRTGSSRPDRLTADRTLCSMLQADAPVASPGGSYPQMSALLVAPFTDNALHGSYDVIIFVKADQPISAVNDIAAELAHQPGVGHVTVFDQARSFQEFKVLFPTDTRVQQSDMPTSARATLTDRSFRTLIVQKFSTDPRVLQASPSSGIRFATGFGHPPSFVRPVTSMERLAAESDLPAAKTITEAWLDIFSLPVPGSTSESTIASAFPPQRLDRLRNEANTLLAQEQRYCR